MISSPAGIALRNAGSTRRIGYDGTHSVAQTEQQGALGERLDLSKLSPSIPDPSSPVTLTYETWQDFTKGALQALAREFHQIHPNITIKFQSVPADSAQTKLTTKIAGGNPPDVAYVDDGGTPRGFLLWDVWGKVASATDLIAAGRPVDEETVGSLA